MKNNCSIQNKENLILSSSENGFKISKKRSSLITSNSENKLKENNLKNNQINSTNTEEEIEDVRKGKISESSSVVKLMVKVFKKVNKSSSKLLNEISEVESLKTFSKNRESISLVNSVMENLQNNFCTSKLSKVERQEEIDQVTKVVVSNFSSHLKPDSFKNNSFEDFNHQKEGERFNNRKKKNNSTKNYLQSSPQGCFIEKFQKPQTENDIEIFTQNCLAENVFQTPSEIKPLKSILVDTNFKPAKNGSGDLNTNLFNLQNEIGLKYSSATSNASLYKKIKTRREKLKSKMKQFIKGIKLQA